MIERLNLTIITMQPLENNINKLLENDSWNGDIGRLQRKEADVGSSGLGINRKRIDYVDFPMKSQVRPMPITLLAAIPKGSDINMWVYVHVFGTVQWIIFFSLMTSFVMVLTTMHILGKEQGWVATELL